MVVINKYPKYIQSKRVEIEIFLIDTNKYLKLTEEETQNSNRPITSKAIELKIKIQDLSHSPLLFKIILEILDRETRQEKEVKVIHNSK
jgi:hypothetical protein